MAAALERHCGEVALFRPPRQTSNPYKKAVLTARFALRVSRLIQKTHFNVVFIAQSPGLLAVLPKKRTLAAYYTDNTWAAIGDYYGYQQSRGIRWRLRHLVERAALHKADIFLCPSSWAARSAEADYGVPPEKIRVIPMGANIDTVPPLDDVLRRRLTSRCSLLFLGVFWERKGGPIAFDTLVTLRERGIDATLTVCGCVPPEEYRHEKMVVIPRLDKNKRRDHEELSRLLREAHFLIVPTRADAFGIVFCEASAYGLPILTTDTGGVSGAVTQGVNGYMLPLAASGTDYAEIISRLYQDEEAYASLVRGSRKMYDEQLNWDVWGETVCGLMRELVESTSRREELTSGTTHGRA
jgi:glycosyltransferase involved in cell wall biosynthesis